MNLNYKILFLGLVFSCFVTPFLLSQNKVDSNGKKQGEWIKFYSEPEYANVIRYKGQFKDDKPIGKFVYYYPSKKVKAIIIHDEKGPRSEAYFYHENEQLASYGIYMNGKKDSIWTNFNEFGYYSSEETFKDDKLNGLKITYYGSEATNGEKVKLVLRKDQYKNGQLNGEFVEYFPDGVTKTKGTYVNGAREGKIIQYYPSGKPMIEERWKNRKKHGIWISFDENGKEEARKYFKNGVSLEGKELEKYLKELKEKGLNPNQ